MVPAQALLEGLLARCAFPAPGTPVTAAVSGGADSLALLALATKAGCIVTAVHVDHGLRADSAAEADRVGAAAERFGAGFRRERVDVAPGPNLEARARSARYGVLPDDVLTGHTADDRAETMLLHLLRGSGPAGMAGIRRTARRPLLDLRRVETVELCRALDLDPLVDPSNVDPIHRRNRVRHELLPLLDDIADRDVVEVLVRQADLFAQLDDDLGGLAAALDPTDCRAVAAAPRSVAAVAVRRWLVAGGVGDGYAVDGGSVGRILAVAAKERRAAEVVGGWRVERRAGRLILVPPPACKDAAHG